jgi:hypothetical protein
MTGNAEQDMGMITQESPFLTIRDSRQFFLSQTWKLSQIRLKKSRELNFVHRAGIRCLVGSPFTLTNLTSIRSGTILPIREFLRFDHPKAFLDPTICQPEIRRSVL